MRKYEDGDLICIACGISLREDKRRPAGRKRFASSDSRGNTIPPSVVKEESSVWNQLKDQKQFKLCYCTKCVNSFTRNEIERKRKVDKLTDDDVKKEVDDWIGMELDRQEEEVERKKEEVEVRKEELRKIRMKLAQDLKE